MKRTTTVFSLLVTAILCLGLVSCDRRIIQPDLTTEPETTSEENTTAQEQSSAEETSQEAEAQSATAADTTAPRTQKPSTTAATTKPVTTKPVTTARPVTTASPITLKPVTTAAPATTAAPETTTAERTTVLISDSEDEDFESTVIRYVNEHRKAQGLSELSYSAELSAAASIRAKEIVESFSHMRPDGTLWNTVSPLAMGENIASGQTTPEAVMDAWMASEGHRNNILTKNFTIIGVGCYYDSASGTYYWVQLFG